MKLRNKLMGLAVAAVMVVSAAVGFAPATAHAANAEVALVPQKTIIGFNSVFAKNKASFSFAAALLTK